MVASSVYRSSRMARRFNVLDSQWRDIRPAGDAGIKHLSLKFINCYQSYYPSTSHTQPTFNMHATTLLSVLPLLALSSAAPVEEVKRATSSSCPSYTIIVSPTHPNTAHLNITHTNPLPQNTRGTGEPQGESSGFRTINSRVRTALSGGKTYNTVYPADFSQNSAAGTRDIVNKIQSTLQSSPNECFILEGYSQGAQATVNAMSQLTGASFDAVKGVFLIGDPAHKRGLACNVDNMGGSTTRDVDGLSARLGGGVPSNWVGKTLDVCIFVSLVDWMVV
jgi:hypothetical protein